VVSRRHYQFDGWLGDVLLEAFPCFIVTELVKQKFQADQLTGAKFDVVEVTRSHQFVELYPTRRLPKFVWLKFDGRAGHDDLGVTSDGGLIVSEKALGLLQERGISRALVTEANLSK